MPKLGEGAPEQHIHERQIQWDVASHTTELQEREIDPMGLAHARKMGDALAHQAGLTGDVASVGALVALAPLLLDSAAAERPPTKAEMRLVLAQRRERLLSIDRDRDS